MASILIVWIKSYICTYVSISTYRTSIQCHTKFEGSNGEVRGIHFKPHSLWLLSGTIPIAPRYKKSILFKNKIIFLLAQNFGSFLVLHVFVQTQRSYQYIVRCFRAESSKNWAFSGFQSQFWRPNINLPENDFLFWVSNSEKNLY